MELWKLVRCYLLVAATIALLCSGCAVTRDTQSGKWERVDGGAGGFPPDSPWFSPGAFPDDMYQH
jgi:hypothetical protein